MNKVVKFFHEIINPHCPDCRDERDAEHERHEDNKVCQSCESMKQQLAFANNLIEKLTNPPTTVEVVREGPPQVTVPKNVPWAVRRQMLEAEDRAKATALKNAAKPTVERVTNSTPVQPQSVEDLEKEILADAEPSSKS